MYDYDVACSELLVCLLIAGGVHAAVLSLY